MKPLILALLAVLVAIAFYLGTLWGSAESSLKGASKAAGDYSERILTSANNEAVVVKELSADVRTKPLEPGRYELRILGTEGEQSISVRVIAGDGGLLLQTDSKTEPTKISNDGIFFDWQSRGYGNDRYIGIRNGSGVSGRVFFSHGLDIGIEHFSLRPKE